MPASTPVQIPQIDPATWTRFVAAKSREEYARNWLALQCGLIPGSVMGVVILKEAAQQRHAPIAQWPAAQPGVERLAAVSDRALSQEAGVVLELEAPAGAAPGLAHYGVAYPVKVGDEVHGVAALEVAVARREQLQTALGQLQWGTSWIELTALRERVHADDAHLGRLRACVDLLAGVLAEESFGAASMAFVTELAELVGCDRVSLGLTRNGRVQVHAISHSAQIAERMNVNRRLALAMEEAISQRADVRHPAAAADEILVRREHEQLAALQDGECVLTIPLYCEGGYYGALTVERPAAQPFDDDTVALCRSAVALAGPALRGKRREDRPLPGKILDALQGQLRRLLGPGHVGRKVALLVVVAVGLCLGLIDDTYRVTADATLEGIVRRAVVAPFDGFIAQSPARAGDVLDSGALLCVLDDRELRLEQVRWETQRAQLQRELQEALASHERVQISLVGARLAQVQAQLDLVATQLGRTQLRAPFAGLVVSGDLSQRLGGPVERGEVLFEVAPLDAYRVILEVDERLVADVSEGQRGELLLKTFPDAPLAFVVDKITPIATAQEGRNAFRVEARLEVPTEALRPGMEGVGKIVVDERPLYRLWSRDVVEWLQLQLWALQP